MGRVALLAAFFSLVAVGPVLAQHPSPKASGAEHAAAQQFVGQWEGSFSTDHTSPGVFRMTFARDTAWKITLDIVMDRPMAPERVTDFKVDGSKVTWNHGLMGGSCRAVAIHDAGTLKGDATCDQGAYSFTLVKK